MKGKGRERKTKTAEIQRLQGMMRYETALGEEGTGPIAGLDEAGRGPLAGPVVVAAVILPPGLMLEGLNDSKQLSAARREGLAERIKKQALAWAVGMVYPPLLDKINIYQATRLAMCQAVDNLSLSPAHLIIDAMRLPALPIPQTSLVKGDCLSVSVAAASVLAKVERDLVMEGLDQIYPGYGFARHKGYATREHLECLRALGPCPVHRQSFEPVKSMIEGVRNGNQGRLFE